MWVVVLVIGTLVGWSVLGGLVGGPAAFALAAGAAVVAGTIGWRHRITFELLCNLALVGVPAVVVGLSLS